MKRSPPDSSCSSSPSSSAGSSSITVPDQQEPELPIKSKRSRKNHKQQVQCKNKNTTTTTTTTTSSAAARRSSIYRGVTRHRWTGRFEAHLWDKSSWNNIQNKKGRQVYLGAYDSEEAAAHTYDLAALKYWGPDTTLNFPIETYVNEVEEMKKVSKEEYLASLRRRSSGFSRGVSKYRGVARHHHNGRWEARIGRVFGNKYLYLGTYNTQEEAAAAYDMAAIEHRGPNAVTNFDISNYIDPLKKKGLVIPQSVAQQQSHYSCEVEQKPNPNHQDQETQDYQPEDKQQDEEREHEMVSVSVSLGAHELHYPQMMMSPCNMDRSSMAVDEHELSWSFCMDAGGFTPLPLPNLLPLDHSGELPDLFQGSGFEDNIDMMFETTMTDSHCNDDLLLSSSPSSMTTTLVSCNYSG